MKVGIEIYWITPTASCDIIDPEMGWRVTATTICCDFASELAVLMVHGDGAAKCAGTVNMLL